MSSLVVCCSSRDRKPPPLLYHLTYIPPLVLASIDPLSLCSSSCLNVYLSHPQPFSTRRYRFFRSYHYHLGRLETGGFHSFSFLNFALALTSLTQKTVARCCSRLSSISWRFRCHTSWSLRVKNRSIYAWYFVSHHLQCTLGIY
jgi:hypothetical protein